MKFCSILLITTCAIFVYSVQVGICQTAFSDAGTAASDPLVYYALSQEAQQLYANKEYEKTAELYRRLADAHPADGNNWLRLGNSRYFLKQYRPAIEAYKKASEIGFGFQQNVAYIIAACYAQLGEKEAALEWLRKSLYEQRYENRARIINDEDFKNLRDDRRFKELAGLAPERTFTRDAGWRFDLDYFMSELKRLNALYSRAPLPANIRQAEANLRRRIPKLTDAQIYTELQRLTALLGQSHNMFFPFLGSKQISFAQLPVTMYLFPEGLFVIDAKEDYKNLIGSRVIRFGESEADKALSAVTRVVSRDNEMELKWSLPHYLSQTTLLYGLGLISDPDKVNLTVENRTGQTGTVQLKAVKLEPKGYLMPSRLADSPTAPLYLKDVPNEFWFEHLPNEKAVYFQFNSVSNKPHETLAAFALRLRRFLNEHADVQNLIVDVRHNNGGNTYLYPELVKTIAAFDAREGNKVYVVIGRNTFSATINFIVDLDRLTNAVFVGEPSGGKPNAHGDARPSILPFSKIQFGLSSVYWQLSSPRDSRAWIAPDIPVELTAKDYFANRDPVMETLIKVIGEKTYL